MQDETIKDTEVKDQNQQCQCQKPECEACSKEAEPAQAQEENAQASSEQEPSVEELLAAAKEENAKLQDLYMRALAEAENARRRAEESVEKAHKFGVEKFAKNLLPVLDSLERPWSSIRMQTIR